MMDESSMAAMLGTTEADLEAEIDSFEKGEWDSADYGEPKFGRPLAFGEPMRPVTFKETESTIRKMDDRAASQGKSRSDYLRDLVKRDLAAV